jgi:hypothetical protein
MDLKKLIREALEDKDCCKAKKPTKAPILNENLAPREILSEGLKYHIDNKKPLTEHVYRAGSTNYFHLWAEARALYTRGILDFSGDDLAILTETHLGEFGYITEIEIGDKVKASKEYGGLSGEVVDIKGSFIVVKTKEGNQSYHESNLKVLNKEAKKVPLDFIMEEEKELEIGDIITINPDSFPNFEFPYGIKGEIVDINKADYASDDLVYTVKIKYIDSQGDETNTLYIEKSYQYLEEAKKAKKKNPPLNKPKRGGSKKFYVYVKAPGGKIKKVSFGDTSGLSAKINNPEARRAFSKRHDCPNKTDKTKASYWSCRLPRYAKLLGLKSNFSGFW